MERVDLPEYLLHSSSTWVLEERLSVLNSYLLSSYSTQLMDRTEIIKTENSSEMDWEKNSEKYPGNMLSSESLVENNLIFRF